MTFKVASAKVKFQVNQPFVQKAAADSYGSGVQVQLAINRSLDAGPRSRNAEHPVLKVKRSYGRPAVECPVTVAAVTEAAGRE